MWVLGIEPRPQEQVLLITKLFFQLQLLFIFEGIKYKLTMGV